MKKILRLVAISFTLTNTTFSEENETHQKIKVPELVKSALHQRYADAKNVTWEKEYGNYEANWGSKSGEENSVRFTPGGKFIEIVRAIAVTDLPKLVFAYIKEHYRV